MAIVNFIPEIWAASNLAYQDKALVYGNIINRNYEGEIAKYGDTVHINQLGDITTFAYTKNTDMTAAETLDDSTSALSIDQQRAFNFVIDDVDKAQTNPKLMTEAMKRAAVALAQDKDVFIAGLYTGVEAANIVGLGSDATALVLTATNVYDTFVTAGILLDEANVPADGRWVVIAPWMKALILKSDDFTGASALGDDVKVNGRIGMVAGFDVYVSNNVINTAGAKYKVMFGTDAAITFADQLQEVVAYTPELRFGDAVKGLDLYGGKLVQTSGIALGTFSKS